MNIDPSEDTVRLWSARALFAVATLTPIVFVFWKVAFKEPAPFTGGGAAAFVGALLSLGLILEFPTVIEDEDGDASTMRILCLAVVLSFCAITLRTGWNQGAIPSLENQGNWVWLVTAAFGGKALQKFAEKKDADKAPRTGGTPEPGKK